MTTTTTLDWQPTLCGLCGDLLRWSPVGMRRTKAWCSCPTGEGTALEDIGFEYAVRLGGDGIVYTAERDLDALID